MPVSSHISASNAMDGRGMSWFIVSFCSDFVQVIIEPQNDVKDAEMPEQMESNENDTFCNETKSLYGADINGISEMDDTLLEETMDNDSDPSFKGGQSEYICSKHKQRKILININ